MIKQNTRELSVIIEEAEALKNRLETIREEEQDLREDLAEKLNDDIQYLEDTALALEFIIDNN